MKNILPQTKHGYNQAIKQRFEIIGNEPKLNRAIEKAIQVAPTDISVLVVGESGVGKESIPKNHRFHRNTWEVHCRKLWCNTGRND
jgi:transcriptional regulator with PAS, ATPase and Fis domain